MSDLRPARKRNAWLPNRMFDPVSNPFAIQNMLDRTAPAFIGDPDERPDSGFGVDPLAGGAVLKAFEVDRGLQLPEDDFAVDPEVSGEFVAGDAMPEAGFEAEEQPDIYAAFTGGDDAVADQPVTEAGSETDLTATVAESATADSPAIADDIAEAAVTAIDEGQTVAEAQAEADADLAQAHGEAEPVSETVESAIAEAETEAETEAEPEPAEPPQPELSSEAVRQQIDAARSEAYAQGLEAGRGEGRDAERPLAHKQGYDEGFAAGVAQGRTESESEAQQRQQQEHQARLDQMQSVIDNLQQLAYNPDAMFEPMKKLAVYLAEQLVRGELTQSPQAISRLVDNALRELNASGDKAVIIHMNPEDLEAYRPTVAGFGDSLILRPDSMLERGSVRVSLDGSVVEDLMQRRVDGLKKSLSQAPAPGWRAGGNSLASRVQQGHPVDDVTIVDNKDKNLETASPADDHA